MSGDANRQGLLFQDRYLLWRLLREAGAVLERRFAQPELPPAAVTRFGVEARPACLQSSGARGPAWDVVAQGPGELEIIEVKSGLIRRADRETFWRRLRLEMSSAQSPEVPRIPMLVADPQRAHGLALWERMAALAASGRARLPRSVPKSAASASKRLDEALWHLCVDRSIEARAVPRAEALAALARLKVERHRAADLERAVMRGIELLFADGQTEQIENMIHGWLDQRAISPHQDRRFLTVKDLFTEMEQFDAAARLAPGSLASWRALWQELPLLFNQRSRINLGHDGPSLDAARTQPAAISLFAGHGGYVLNGQAGTGKTALLWQYAERESEAGTEVFRVAADTVADRGELGKLLECLRFKRALTALQAPERGFWLGVDGLDEVNNGELRRHWALGLERFVVGARTTVMASVRSSAWQEHDALHSHLNRFTILPVEDWPEELVREALARVPGGEPVSPGLFGLLRRALFLDLFLRTFADLGSTLPPVITSRHDLLKEFWNRRVFGSKRPKPDDFPSRLDDVLRAAAGSVGGFASSPLDQRTVALLVSEGVLVAEGGHAFRHRFRHPLLRDHALAFWCLEESGSGRVVERWRSIRGHLQAQGALRVILEMLSTADAATSFPAVQLQEVITTLAGQPESARSLVRQLGALPPTSSLDPATWSTQTQAALPGEFGRALVAAARAEMNGAWAEVIRQWPPAAPWLDAEFLAMLCGYTEILFQFSNRRVLRGGGERDTAELAALRHARLAAGKLRSLISHDRFAAVVAHNRRHLQASALAIIIKLDPGDDTFDAVERELPVATHVTRITILQGLALLASHDPSRAAAVFQQVVGLETGDDGPTLDPARWQPSLLAYEAIDGVLGGKTGKRSVLAGYPREFMQLALEFAEALSATDYPLPAGRIVWKDLLHWPDFWDPNGHHRPVESCLQAIRRACGEMITANPASFLHEVAPLLWESPSPAVRSIYLDVLLERPEDTDYLAALRNCLLDAWCYRVPRFLHWLEEALRRCWPRFDAEERTQVLALIEGMASGCASTSPAGFRRAQLLATVPAHDLSEPRLRELAAPRAADYYSVPHPRYRPPVVPVHDPSDVDRDPDAWQMAEWPPGFADDTLRPLSAGLRLISARGVTDETIRDHLPRMMAAAEILLRLLENRTDTLEHPRRLWMWEALTLCMRKGYADRLATPAPPPGLIGACAHLALCTLEEGVPSSGNRQTFFASYAILEIPWGKALRLADAALMWPSTQADESLQRRFEQVWRDAFTNGSPAVQAAVTREVQDHHWAKDEARQRLDDELVWTPPRHGTVLAVSISRLDCMKADRQKRHIRRMLGRAPVGGGNELAEALGRWLGHEAMDVWRGNTRPPAASLVDEIADAPQRWAMLDAPRTRRVFIFHFMLGMRYVASQRWQHAPLLAADYGRWNLAFWRAMRAMGGSENEAREVVSFPLSWIPKNNPVMQANPPLVPPEPADMKIWWRGLQSFCRAIVEEGIEEDVYHLLYDLRPGQMNHVLEAREVFEWLTILLDRLEPGLGNQTMSLDLPTDGTRHQSWKENLCYAVHALHSLRADELLFTDQLRESAVQLLERMASPPFKLDLAMHSVPQFRES